MLPAPTQSFAAVFETVHRLRAPGGCPWDGEQTHQSLRPFLIEEAYEVLDAIDALGAAKDEAARAAAMASFKEELGDLLLQILLHAEIASETQAFDFAGVAAGLDDKLIRRHPHVFAKDSGATAADSEAVLQNWEKQKAKEKAAKAANSSVLDGTPSSLPALQRAARVIDKVSKVGFQWPDLTGPIAKLDEEIGELKAELAKPQVDAGKVAGELGDLLFCVANVARFVKTNPEDALRGTLAKFERRFRHVETRLREQGRAPQDATLEEMDRFWDEAKARESGAV